MQSRSSRNRTVAAVSPGASCTPGEAADRAAALTCPPRHQFLGERIQRTLALTRSRAGAGRGLIGIQEKLQAAERGWLPGRPFPKYPDRPGCFDICWH